MGRVPECAKNGHACREVPHARGHGGARSRGASHLAGRQCTVDHEAETSWARTASKVWSANGTSSARPTRTVAPGTRATHVSTEGGEGLTAVTRAAPTNLARRSVRAPV